MTSRRLDALLVERGLAVTRSRAQAMILAGSVRVAGQVVTKSGTHLPDDSELFVEQPPKFVSRAGEKLDHALDDFDLDVTDLLCLDAGASTGGFTDVLLKRGAEAVISVDVGYGQFDWNLRNDGRVHVMERTNVRYLGGDDLPFQPTLLVSDLSFISLAVALRNLLETTPSISELVLLVKPQFEAGPEKVGRGGVVKDAEVHEEVALAVISDFRELDFGAVGFVKSAVTGKKSGNQEYVMRLVRGSDVALEPDDIYGAVYG